MSPANQDIVVAKFGGSSLATTERVRGVADKVASMARSGNGVVVVVSAMGRTTTDLLETAREVADDPPRRELDMLLSAGERMSIALLAMALEGAGQPAISLTGPQCGIITDNVHTNATILDVRPERVLRELAAGNVVIVAGYQGLSISGEVTTLGRGGSDTTAVALAGALRAARCGIYSDVPGVFSADPRLVEGARHLRQVEIAPMREYAELGARVLHPAAIEHALASDTEVHACSTFDGSRSTLIAGGAALAYSPPHMEQASVVGVTSRKQRVLLSAADAGTLRAELDRLPEDVRPEGVPEGAVELLLDIEDAPDPDALIGGLGERRGDGLTVETGLASLSVVTLAECAKAPAKALDATLRSLGIPVKNLELRPHAVTCALPSRDRERAMGAVHRVLVEDPRTAPRLQEVR